MPLIPILPPPAAWLHVLRTPAALHAPESSDRTVIIDAADTQEYDRETNTITCTGGIVAHYGLTTIRCDQLVLDYGHKKGHAAGNVKLDDEAGSLECQDLDFDWEAHTGSANNVTIHSTGMHGTAAKIEITPMKWTLLDVFGTPSARQRPDIALRSNRVTLSPGRKGTIAHPRVEILGLKLPSLPTSTFSLDRRVEGLRIPAISFRRKAGIGLTWSSGILLDDRTALSAQTASFPDNLPTTVLALSRSNVKPSKSSGFILPQSDLAERTSNGYFSNVNVERPEDESDALRVEKQTYTVQSAWNLGTSARLNDAIGLSKRLEGVAEIGGAIGAWGGWTQLRVQNMRPSTRDRYRTRAVSQSTLSAPIFRLTNNVALTLRSDLWSSSSGYGWLRGEVGLVAKPVKQLQIGAAFVGGKEWGDPDFEFDRIVSRRAVHLRADLFLGSIQGSLLFKYDTIRHRWMDTEWGFSFVAGSFEPYISTRLFPRETRIGVRLRIDEFTRKLSRREQKRNAPSKQATRSDDPGRARSAMRPFVEPEL